jgi:NAD-dependent SIR2 family protein deacetylase
MPGKDTQKVMEVQSEADRVLLRKATKRLAEDKSERVAVFTGAGVSFCYGYPLTNKILPTMVKWENDTDFLEIPGEKGRPALEKRATLKALLEQLIPGGRQDPKALPLVTTLLSVIDYAIERRQPLWPGSTVEKLREARRILDQAIFDVLGEYKPFLKDEEKALWSFGGFLREVQSRRKNRRVGLITSNYDLSSEWATLYAQFNRQSFDGWTTTRASAIDFGTEWLDPFANGWTKIKRPPAPDFCCYKLHGSTGWLRCPICQQIYINCTGGTWFQGFRSGMDYNNQCDCSDTQLEAQIVSPSFVRRMDDLNLLNIWNHSHTLLSNASHWIIMGYSLPEEDISIRALFTRAMHCRKTPLRVTVVQHGKDSFDKYNSMFGSHSLHFVSGGLVDFLASWREAIEER